MQPAIALRMSRKNYIFQKKDFVFNEVQGGFHEKYA
jgi:hypothetical protein